MIARSSRNIRFFLEGRRQYNGGRPRPRELEFEHVKSAIEAVANGLSLRKAANMFCISKSVLHRYSKLGIPVLMKKYYMRNDSISWSNATPCD